MVFSSRKNFLSLEGEGCADLAALPPSRSWVRVSDVEHPAPNPLTRCE